MKLTITATGTLTTIDGVPVRLWEGVTEKGVRCQVFVHLIAALGQGDCSEFDQELAEQLPPGETVPLVQVLRQMAPPAPKAEVFSREDCVFQYCPYTNDACREKCQHPLDYPI